MADTARPPVPFRTDIDVLHRRYDGPVPLCYRNRPEGAGQGCFGKTAVSMAARARAAIGRQRRSVGAGAVLDDAALRRGVRDLAWARAVAVYVA